MPSPVEIVIRAVDEFGPAFTALDEALRRTDGAGAAAQAALAGVGGSLERLGDASADADAALAEFAAGAGARLGALDAERTEALEQLAAQHTEVAQRLADELLVLDEGSAATRLAQLQAQLARHQQVWQQHAAAVLAINTASVAARRAVEEHDAGEQLERTRQRLALLRSLAEGHGGTLARTAKALAVAEALIAAYLAGNKALAAVPFPFNLAAAAAVTAQGLASVERIRQVGVAHGGLEDVPEDGTFLLQRGERVLSANQNRELSRFLERGEPSAPAGVTIENLRVHVLENATSAAALLSMEPAELRQVVSERLVPMLDELARLGIRPHFVRGNT
jgi:hypothetical protein